MCETLITQYCACVEKLLQLIEYAADAQIADELPYCSMEQHYLQFLCSQLLHPSPGYVHELFFNPVMP